MKVTTMYLLMIIGWFVAGLPIYIAVFIFATSELKKEHTKNELIGIRIAQIISIILAVLMGIYLIK